MRKSGTGAGEPAGHRLHLSYLLFPTPEGGGKTRLGGEVRREEQLLPRVGKSADRDGTDEDLSEGFFHMPFPLAPARPESHRTRGQARLPRPAHVDIHPRSCWSRPRMVETSDTFFHIIVSQKIRIVKKFDNYRFTCMFRRYRHCQWRGWD
jgi:hypothetical protein